MSPQAANGSANEKPGKSGMREPERRDILEISAGQEACEAEQRTTDLKVVTAPGSRLPWRLGVLPDKSC